MGKVCMGKKERGISRELERYDEALLQVHVPVPSPHRNSSVEDGRRLLIHVVLQVEQCAMPRPSYSLYHYFPLLILFPMYFQCCFRAVNMTLYSQGRYVLHTNVELVVTS